ncbi:MAG: hypothetical protein AABW81_02490 [Nanoarchaeota archaeon]
MNRGHIIIVFVILIFGLFLFFVGWKSANIILDSSEVYAKGDFLEGNLVLNIEKNDFLREETPILISLSKKNNVLAVKTLTLKEFIEVSGKEPKFVEREGFVYYTEEKYEVEVSKIINYSFNEVGEYELFFSLLELDFSVNKKINVR